MCAISFHLFIADVKVVNTNTPYSRSEGWWELSEKYNLMTGKSTLKNIKFWEGLFSLIVGFLLLIRGDASVFSFCKKDNFTIYLSYWRKITPSKLKFLCELSFLAPIQVHAITGTWVKFINKLTPRQNEIFKVWFPPKLVIFFFIIIAA